MAPKQIKCTNGGIADIPLSNSKKRGLEQIQEALAIDDDDDDAEYLKVSKSISKKSIDAGEDVDRVVVDTSTCDAQSPPLPRLPSHNLTPKKPARLRSTGPDTATETPTKGARTFLSSLALSSPSSQQISSSPLPAKPNTPPTSPTLAESLCPKRRGHQELELPSELQDLIDLHSAFLTALSLHHAHHGSLVPADLRELRPSVERAWGKRRVGAEDVRRVLGLLGGEGGVRENSKRKDEVKYSLMLSDYGKGKICVELRDITKHGRRPINVESLKTQFLDTLERRWQCYVNSIDSSSDPAAFIASLPLASVRPSSSLPKISPLLAKGQRRLTDLKAGAIRSQIANKDTASLRASKPSPRPEAVTSRSSDLLTRILAKQHHQSTLPLPPSPENIARKSSIQRLEEIIPVLDILTTSGSRTQLSDLADSTEEEMDGGKISFTMSTLVQHMQMSLRNPISKDEAKRCVTVLANEIAPDWVSVRVVGKIVGVMVRKKAIGKEEMAGRLRKALETS